MLAWSFNHLQLGIWPKADWNGRAYPAGSEKARRGGLPLANGFFAVICALIGDLDYLNKTLNLPHWQKISNPCAICKVGQNEWQNFKVDAEWTSLAWRPHEWKHWNGRSKSCLFEVNGLSAAAVHCDWLHAKYLGHDQYCLGSVIYLLVHYLLPEASPQGNLKRFWSWLQAVVQKSPNKGQIWIFCNHDHVYQQEWHQVERKGCPDQIFVPCFDGLLV